MITLVGATALLLAGLQAGINAPRNAFNDCLTQASTKAAAEKVPAEAYDAYLQNACGGQIEAFKKASIAFDVKNGIGRKQSAADAELMISDWVKSSVESYKTKASAKAN